MTPRCAAVFRCLLVLGETRRRAVSEGARVERRGGIAASVPEVGNSVRAGDSGSEGFFYVNMSSNAQNRSVAVQKVGIPSVPPWGKKLPI
jgi:hypothetical protein